MNRRDAAIQATRRDLDRQAERDRVEQARADRAAAREVEHDHDARDRQRARLRDLVRADPTDRQRIDDQHDAREADALLDRTTAPPLCEPVGDFDAGKGNASERHTTPSWRDPETGDMPTRDHDGARFIHDHDDERHSHA